MYRPNEPSKTDPRLDERRETDAMPELGDSWFGKTTSGRAITSRPPPPPPIDDPLADAWFV